MVMFLAKSSQTRRKRQIWHSSFWVQGTSLEGVPRETTILGGRGGREMKFNLPLHQHESDVESYGKAFRALFCD